MRFADSEVVLETIEENCSPLEHSSSDLLEAKFGHQNKMKSPYTSSGKRSNHKSPFSIKELVLPMFNIIPTRFQHPPEDLSLKSPQP